MAARQYIDKTISRLGSEKGTIHKSHTDRLRFAIAFPNTYFVGMSNLGFQTVYGLLNALDDVVCERVFLPDPSDMDDACRIKTGLFTMESQTPVHDFDVLGFSLSYELDYPNALSILRLSGIPERSAERTDGDYPLIIAGGPAVTFNPEPLAPFVDAFIIGEAEGVISDLADRLVTNRDAAKAEQLKMLAQVPGVYVPSLYTPIYDEDGAFMRMEVCEGAPERVRKQWVRDLDERPTTTVILTPETEFSNMVLSEIARGCGRQCRFCAAGYTYLPPRRRSDHSVIESLAKAEELFGRHKAGLVSASVFDNPSALSICESLAEQERLFSISSTRADTLTERIVEVLHGGGHETLTIAPEAGTDRLRRVINKCITEEDIFRAAGIAWDGGFKRLRLYFMIGLPTETDEDIEGIIRLASEISALYPWRKIGVSVSCFVPKPWTPFQWCGMSEEKELERTLSMIRSSLRHVRHLDMAGESSREAVSQGVLARGDRRIADALLVKSRGKGNWRTAFRESGIDTRFYAQRERRADEAFPWDHLDLGVKKEYLRRQYAEALLEAENPPCDVGVCRRCGVCEN